MAKRPNKNEAEGYELEIEMDPETGEADVTEERELSEEEMQAVLEEAARMLQQQEARRQEILDSLGQMVERKFTSLQSAKVNKRAEMIRSLELFNGSLARNNRRNSVREMFRNEEAAPAKPYPNIVRSKCRNVISQLYAGQFATGENNWDLRPSPAIMPMSQIDPVEAIKNMKSEIADQLNECAYGREYRKIIEDFVILGTGIMKGPGNSSQFQKTYVPQQASDGSVIYVPEIIPVPRPGLWRVNPFFAFPDDSTNDPNEIGVFIEAHIYSPMDFFKLKDHQGFLMDQIKNVVDQRRDAGGASKYSEELLPTIGDDVDIRGKYIVKEYHGVVDIETLKELGIVEDDSSDFANQVLAEIWVCDGVVIRVAMPLIEYNWQPPYAIAAYEPDPGSVMGYGLPLLLESQQRTVKTTFECLLDNVALSSLPQVIIDKTKIAPADVGGDYSVRPGKAWVVDEYGENGVADAISFVNIPSQQDALQNFIQFSMALAEMESGVSEIIGGLQSPVAAETGGATGLAIQNQNALTPLLYKQEILSDNVTKKCIRWMYDWNMQFNPREDIKCDAEVDVRTPIQWINAQSEKLDLERLSMEMVQNPEIAAKVDAGKLTALRLSTMHVPHESILRTPEEEEAWRQEQAENQAPDPNMIKAEAEMIVAQTRQAEVELKREQLQFDKEEGHRQAELEYMRYMENQQTRLQEAEARVLAEQLKYNTKMAELAMRSETDRARIMAELEKTNMNNEIALFRAGQDNALKAKQLEQTDQELQIKRQGGTGI